MAKKEKVDNSKIIDSYILDANRADKVKALMKDLPKDSFMQIKKDKNILIPFAPAARDQVEVVLDVLTEDLSEQEIAMALLKCNTNPDDWEKEQITFTKREWAIYFTLDLLHSIGYYAMDQDSIEIIKDEKLYSDVSTTIDQNVGLNRKDEIKDEEESNSKGPIVIKPTED